MSGIAFRKSFCVLALAVVLLLASASVALATMTRFEETAAQIAYGGSGWGPPFVYDSTVSPALAYKYSPTPGSTMTFTFTGTGVDWRSTKATNCGLAQVWVDAEAPATVDLFNGSTLRQQLLWGRTGLSNGPHVLHVTNVTPLSRSNRNVGVDYFDVYAPSTVTATAGPHGAISPAGAVSVEHGADQEFTITPDSGYKVDDVLVDGHSVGALEIYRLPAVTDAHTISVSFSEVPVLNSGSSSSWTLVLAAMAGLAAVFVVRQRVRA